MRLRRLSWTSAILTLSLAAAAFAADPPPAKPKFPAVIATPALTVTGDAGAVPRMPPTLNTPALIVTGDANPPPKFSTSIATPGLVVTGTAP
jgi:hypothetical protein